MIQLLLSVLIGASIGAITNELAIRMLFRPYEPWKIGGWQIPFTPGLIPKRRGELAEQLGHMVENYLFTAKGLKEFIENSGMKEKLYQKILEKLRGLQAEDKQLGDVLVSVLSIERRSRVLTYSKQRILTFLFASTFKEKTVDQLLPQTMLAKIDQQIEGIAKNFVIELKEYLHSEQGGKWLESIIIQLLEGKKMLGFLAGMLFDGGQVQQKLVTYLDQLLDQPDAHQVFVVFLEKEWNQWKEKPIKVLLEPMEPYISEHMEEWLDLGIYKMEEIPLKTIIDRLIDSGTVRQMYDHFFESFEVRLEKWFAYLSISKVVKEEVNRFSLRELEKMIVEISGKELKMITVFGGILGGFIGLVQGLLFYFY